MAATSLSHLICSMGLVVLILVIPVFYSMERDILATRITQIELSEIADYTSNTLANLYFLANSTNNLQANLTKQLLYLPMTVEDSPYTLSIVSIDGNASKITASLRDQSSISSDSWLVPGLKAAGNFTLEVMQKPIIAGCYRNEAGFYVWLGYGE